MGASSLLRVSSISAARVLVWGAIVLLPVAAAQAQLANGSFEDPEVPSFSFTNFNLGDDIGGWTAVGGQVSVVDGGFAQNGVSFVAQSGEQWLDLTGFSANSSEGVEQTVTTEAGATYDLTFFVGNVTAGGIFGTSSTVNVFIDGNLEDSVTNSDGTDSLNWKEFTVPFTADDTSTTIRFINADPSNDNSNGLDNVTLVKTGEEPGPTPVIPLPPAVWSGLLTMGGLIGARTWKTLRGRGAGRGAAVS